jgi:uncharacterized protein YbbC (DUF1343 family)
MTASFKKFISFIGLLFFIASCSVNKTIQIKNATPHSTTTETQKHIRPTQPIDFKTGADDYKNYLSLLKDKKVGVVSNQTGILTNGIVDGKETKTGLPIISLYGSNKKPKPEQLEGIDILVFDIQDVGARFYTYISSLHYIMEACAENNIPLLVLDRPNPNGFIIDGPVLEKEFSSFVGMHPVPVLYGMTIGEYAQMINGEKWLKDQVQCNLKVIPCVHYDRNASYHLSERPSPNLPNDQAINLYVSLCFFEGTNVSVGRGTDKQFQIYGSPFLPNTGFSFTPEPNLGAREPMHKDAICYGEDLSTIEPVNQIELKWLIRAYNTTEDKTKFFNPFFTKLAGTQMLQHQIEEGISERKIKKSWKPGLDQFKEIRKKYLLY